MIRMANTERIVARIVTAIYASVFMAGCGPAESPPVIRDELIYERKKPTPEEEFQYRLNEWENRAAEED
jgi:hypothetical protein